MLFHINQKENTQYSQGLHSWVLFLQVTFSDKGTKSGKNISLEELSDLGTEFKGHWAELRVSAKILYDLKDIYK